MPGGQAAGGGCSARAVGQGGRHRGRPVGHGSGCDERHGACRGRRGGHQRGRVKRGSSAAELGRVRPTGRVTRQRLSHERDQRRGEAVQVRLPVDDPVEDRLEGPGAERRTAGGGERHRGSPRMHIRGGPARLPLDHLGREVAGRAHEHAGLGEPGGVGNLGYPEVDHDRLAIGDHDVARLEIAVHHASRVHRGQGQGQSRGQPGQLRASQRALLADHVLERLAAHIPGHDVRRIAGHVRVEHLGDERAAHPPHGLDLAGQPPPRIRIRCYRRPQRLDSDPALLLVGSQVDHAHAALAEPLQQAVRPEPFRRVVLSCHDPTSLRISLLPHLNWPTRKGGGAGRPTGGDGRGLAGVLHVPSYSAANGSAVPRRTPPTAS